jgi:hypothetical protein
VKCYACLASARPWFQTPLLPKKKKSEVVTSDSTIARSFPTKCRLSRRPGLELVRKAVSLAERQQCWCREWCGLVGDGEDRD